PRRPLAEEDKQFTGYKLCMSWENAHVIHPMGKKKKAEANLASAEGIKNPAVLPPGPSFGSPAVNAFRQDGISRRNRRMQNPHPFPRPAPAPKRRRRSRGGGTPPSPRQRRR